MAIYFIRIPFKVSLDGALDDGSNTQQVKAMTGWGDDYVEFHFHADTKEEAFKNARKLVFWTLFHSSKD